MKLVTNSASTLFWEREGLRRGKVLRLAAAEDWKVFKQGRKDEESKKQAKKRVSNKKEESTERKQGKQERRESMQKKKRKYARKEEKVCKKSPASQRTSDGEPSALA